MQTTITQLSSSRVRSMRRPSISRMNAKQKRPDAELIDEVASAGVAMRLVARKKIAPADNPAEYGQPTCRRYIATYSHAQNARAGRRAHEAGKRGLARRHRVAHELGVEDRLEEHGHERDPEQRHAVADKRRRSEKELAAAERQTEDDHTGPDDLGPLKTGGRRGLGKIGQDPRFKAGPRFRARRRALEIRTPRLAIWAPGLWTLGSGLFGL